MLRWLELKVPPPLVALSTAAAMLLVSRIVAPLSLSFGLRRGVAAAIGGIAFSFAFAGLASFRRAKTTINPSTPGAASALVRTGVYGFTRNPMYLGLLLCLVAWTVFLANPVNLLLLPLFVLYMNRFQIGPEERALAALFGAEYAAYQSTVRRWL